mmetsp:Transcript_48254/g.134715  ORF Transcript_48254/g.134715 Transcript_48254/m.134715 type:complete len:613 (-) Transcript_48254:41-1879(-)
MQSSPSSSPTSLRLCDEVWVDETSRHRFSFVPRACASVPMGKEFEVASPTKTMGSSKTMLSPRVHGSLADTGSTREVSKYDDYSFSPIRNSHTDRQTFPTNRSELLRAQVAALHMEFEDQLAQVGLSGVDGRYTSGGSCSSSGARDVPAATSSSSVWAEPREEDLRVELSAALERSSALEGELRLWRSRRQDFTGSCTQCNCGTLECGACSSTWLRAKLSVAQAVADAGNRTAENLRSEVELLRSELRAQTDRPAEGKPLVNVSSEACSACVSTSAGVSTSVDSCTWKESETTQDLLSRSRLAAEHGGARSEAPKHQSPPRGRRQLEAPASPLGSRGGGSVTMPQLSLGSGSTTLSSVALSAHDARTINDSSPRRLASAHVSPTATAQAACVPSVSATEQRAPARPRPRPTRQRSLVMASTGLVAPQLVAPLAVRAPSVTAPAVSPRSTMAVGVPLPRNCPRQGASTPPYATMPKAGQFVWRAARPPYRQPEQSGGSLVAPCGGGAFVSPRGQIPRPMPAAAPVVGAPLRSLTPQPVPSRTPPTFVAVAEPLGSRQRSLTPPGFLARSMPVPMQATGVPTQVAARMIPRPAPSTPRGQRDVEIPLATTPRKG